MLFYLIGEKLTQGVKQQEHNTENPHDAKRFRKGLKKNKRGKILE